MSDEKKPDVTLSDGRQVRFNLNLMTVKEWRGFLGEVSAEAEDTLVERCAGFDPGTVDGLGYDDWQALTKAFYNRIRGAKDPN